VKSTARGVGVTPDPRVLRYVDESPIKGVRDANWHVQDAAGHPEPRTTRRYDRARYNLDRHPTYAFAGVIK